jgi:hypothetical protein
MRKRLKKQEWWFYLVILVACFILAGAIHTFMEETRGGAKGPPEDAEWKEAVRKVLVEPVDETMMEKLRKGYLDESDWERIEKARSGELNEEDRRKLKEAFERFKKEGRLGEQPSK